MHGIDEKRGERRLEGGGGKGGEEVSVKVDPIDRREGGGETWTGILGIGVPSGPINLSSSQETGLVRRCRRDLNGQRGRQAGRQAAKGKYRSGYPRPSIGPSLHVCFATVSITGSNASPFDLSCLDKLINADLRISFPILETVREIFQPRFCHALFVIYEGTGEWSVDSFQIRCRGGFSTIVDVYSFWRRDDWKTWM